MHVEYWSYSGVNEDGTFGQPPDLSQGSVRTVANVDTSGDHWRKTPSTTSAGCWMSVSTGRMWDGTVHGITLFFKDAAEMQEFEQTRTYGPDHRQPPEDPNDPTLAADWWKK